MANRFSQNFTLADIFNNKKLAGKIPLINYKERVDENGKVSMRTNAKTVNRQIYDTAKKAARPFYKPLIATLSGNTLILGGNTDTDLNSVVDAVYGALIEQRQIIVWTANNADIIRDALKESEKNRRYSGINTKLYLRAQSMQEIEGMSKQQIQALMTDIMENIVYGNDFPKTQKKWKVSEMKVKSPFNYEQRKQAWEKKVGI